METAIKFGVTVLVLGLTAVLLCCTGALLSGIFNLVVVDWYGAQVPRMDWLVGTAVVLFIQIFRCGNGGRK